MQKYILVLPAKLKKHLVGLFIVLTSLVNTAANAAVSPIPLLVEQCLRFDFPTLAIDPSLDSKSNAITLERQLIGFFNINDRIKYYRHFPLSYADRELLLQCQLYLADELALYLDSVPFQSIQFSLAKNQQPQMSALLTRINHLSKSSMSPKLKAQLHTAQAAFKQEISTQALSLNIADSSCQISKPNTESVVKNFNGSLASYLINQADEQCRKRVWQAYQSRASGKNKLALATIEQLRQQQATQAGFASYSEYLLQRQMLHSSELVEQFLRTQTDNIAIAPWNIGSELANASPTKVSSIDSTSWLVMVENELQALEVRFDWINNKTIRLWHRNRLLGDIYLSESKKVTVKPIRQLVVGQQFGQIELSFPTELAKYQQQKQAIKAISTAITKLAKGQQFYLLNTISETDDSSNLDALWLENWLADRMLPLVKDGSREAVLQLYSEQLNVFRAKIALNLYRAHQQKNSFDPHQQFYLSFGKYWDKTADAPYTFSAIVYQGPLYYQKLWQQKVAEYIYQSTKNCQDQAAVFDTLVVNEASNSIETVLTMLLGLPINADSLIKRIQHGFDAQNKHTSSCTFLRQ
ncbi:M3 family metallopeptidase [Shewanella sp. 10N.286.45.A1]|uniref:M3 family metallopeptidase n=1 Tax=Shewanella sp. 10N.286.45.A1 TaxID=3229694 RepID=UPI00354BBC6D